MVLVHTGVKTQPSFHRPTSSAVLNPISEVVKKVTGVTLCDNFHAHDAVRCQEDSAKLLVQFKVIGGAIKEKTDGV